VLLNPIAAGSVDINHKEPEYFVTVHVLNTVTTSRLCLSTTATTMNSQGYKRYQRLYYFSMFYVCYEFIQDKTDKVYDVLYNFVNAYITYGHENIVKRSKILA